jgi:hypothetical protein
MDDVAAVEIFIFCFKNEGVMVEFKDVRRKYQILGEKIHAADRAAKSGDN